MSRLRHLGWNQCSHGLSSRPLESCQHQCLKAVCGLLGYPEGSASELLDGTLKLRHCTEVFSMRFHPWSLPEISANQLVTPGHLLDTGGNVGKRVWLTRDTSKCIFSCYSGSRASNAEEMEKIALPSSEGVGGEVGVLQSFSSTKGLGEVCTGDAWNLPSDGTGVGFFPAGQSSRRGWCTGTSPF